MKPPFEVRSFKCASWEGRVSAFCMACPWTDHGEGNREDKNAIKRVCAHAKKHAQQTGHDVRLNHTHQRGYEPVDAPAPTNA